MGLKMDELKIKTFLKEFMKVENLNGALVVEAEELHNFLEVKRECAPWVGSQIKKHSLIKDEGYFLCVQYKRTQLAGFKYYFSLPAVVQISAGVNSHFGEHVRSFFNIPKKPTKEKQKESLPYLGIKEAACILGITEKEVRRYTAKGLLPCLRENHKAVKYKEEDVRFFFKQLQTLTQKESLSSESK